ncbi:MAG: hypothetical protein COW18_02470 [Zetaproteobacteria bacterium CG12_big_fil_rev_8_21_14_0_65_54_13]|nr:MAG: hypothetical protein AUJ57_10750 [Zetaproteobacteria bacterium CG1_02_53_45]PIW51078.1 MAG: hypothetical protein COW18_02470 [Zetaproteobacteria bacterium CG12_big_fil_rev_8_21_14_0_65_54_13]PIX55197.1 MAG: hypothetical protein COZ50_03805 [Zetaproteobacteria bacterium CG_4_10_14_3_um_filter_54_28]PJA28079.1 MAG: hypothetical protein CO188_10470 [Zetaproteobacteria bacterium CG_4_9_14_3_um_filter_54_145]
MQTTLPAAPDAAAFNLLLELTHPNGAMQAPEMVAAVNDPHFNQHTFLQMVRWHRVTPQVYQRLAAAGSDLPADFFQRLQAENMHCRQQHLRQATWLAGIARALRTDRVAFIVPKGAALSQRLYGNQGYRQCRDIDIMVDAENVDRVEAILFAAGFMRTMPHAEATPKQLRFLDRHKKDREYIHGRDRTRVELHWRLIDVAHPFNPSLKELLADAEWVSIHGESIPTLSGPLLWLYQCLHGSVSGWYRLRWLCDIALLMHDHPPAWHALLQQAKKYHCRNSLLEAVGLACAFYRMPVPVEPFSLISTIISPFSAR